MWQARLGAAHPTPQELVEEELRSAAEKGRITRVRLLIDVVDDVDGIGTNHPLLEGRTADQLAVLYGHTEIAALLVAAGAAPRPFTPVESCGPCACGRTHLRWSGW